MPFGRGLLIFWGTQIFRQDALKNKSETVFPHVSPAAMPIPMPGFPQINPKKQGFLIFFLKLLSEQFICGAAAA